jgi:DNA-binding transcriptional MerR regulator
MSRATEAVADGTPAPRYRMKDLCALSGLTRQAIHFYIQQGLLPEGTKTGRNMAWYGREHLERIELIRRLQDERFLPLKAIRAILDDETAGLAASQRGLLLEVKARLPAGITGSDPPALADLDDAAARHGVVAIDVDRLIEAGLLAVREVDGRRRVPATSLWLLDAWAQLRALGFTDEVGFSPQDLAVYEEAATQLMQREAQLLIGRLSNLPPAQVATLIDRALPIVHSAFLQFHTAAVRSFFAALDFQVSTPDAAPEVS